MATFPQVDSSVGEANGETLSLPIGGKTYTFDLSIPMERGIQITRMREEVARRVHAKANGTTPGEVRDETRVELDDQSEIQMYLDLIGEDMRAQMAADGVSWPDMLRVGSTLFAWHFAGEAAARIAWQGDLAGGDDNPPAEPPASSRGQKTSPTSSTKKKTSGTKAATSRGATTSTGGDSSKRTSTASTKSTSQRRKS